MVPPPGIGWRQVYEVRADVTLPTQSLYGYANVQGRGGVLEGVARHVSALFTNDKTLETSPECPPASLCTCGE